MQLVLLGCVWTLRDIFFDENIIILVYGKPGLGKSVALTEFARRELATAPIIIRCSRNITWKVFLEMLAASIGLDPHSTGARLENMIAEKLSRLKK